MIFCGEFSILPLTCNLLRVALQEQMSTGMGAGADAGRAFKQEAENLDLVHIFWKIHESETMNYVSNMLLVQLAYQDQCLLP